MSSEVCPFCGKAFKRLKSHLPHCKAAARDKEPPLHHEESAASSSSEPDKSKPTVKRGKPVQMASVETEKSKNVLTLTKKTKLKLSEQIIMATKMSSPASVLSLPTTLASKSKKKSHVFNHISENAKETASQKLNLTELTPATNQTKDAKETKKKQLQAVFLNKTSSNDAKVNVKSVTSDSKESFWSEDTGKHKDWRENDSREAKITLQDVRTALGRVKQNGHREFIVEKSATEDLQSESRTQNQVSLVTAVQSVSGVTPKSEKREVVLSKRPSEAENVTKIC